jgi:hypothetical protein
MGVSRCGAAFRHAPHPGVRSSLPLYHRHHPSNHSTICPLGPLELLGSADCDLVTLVPLARA